MGIGERVLRYNNAPERGWKARTLEEMTAIYAPDSDGNDSKAYAAFLGGKLGISPDAEINFRDPKILAGLIRWMPIMEHGGDRVKISAAEAEAAAHALLRGEKPHITGEAERTAPGSMGSSASLFSLSPADKMKFQGWIESGKRKRVQEAGLTASAFNNQIAYGMDREIFPTPRQLFPDWKTLEHTKKRLNCATSSHFPNKHGPLWMALRACR